MARIFCGGVPITPVRDHEPRQPEGGRCVIFDVHYSGVLLCAELQSSLKEWAIAETCLFSAYDVKHLTFPLLYLPIVFEGRINRTVFIYR